MNRNPVHQKALSLFLSIALVLGIFTLGTVGALAYDNNTRDIQYLNGQTDEIAVDLDNGPITFWNDSGNNAFFQGSLEDFQSNRATIYRMDSGDSVRITQSNPSESTPHSVFVWSTAFPLSVTLDGVNIDTSNSGDPSSINSSENEQSHCAFCMSSVQYMGTVNLTLNGTNTLKSGSLFAGLQVDQGSSLTVSGSGSLTAWGGAGASGIGGGVSPNYSYFLSGYKGCGDITVNGGTVTANGGAADTVTLNNNTSVPVYGGAGIGGGGGSLSYNGGNGGDIAIGGNAEVTSNGNGGGAGIGGGGGKTGGSGGTVSISGGTVAANGSTAYYKNDIDGSLLRSAGIGGGGGIDIGGSGGSITISGGIVTAKSSGAAMAPREHAPTTSPDGFKYGGTVSQGNNKYDIYYGFIQGYRFQAVPVNNDGTQGAFSARAQIVTDGAGIGSGGYAGSEISQRLSGDGGAITISGGTVTANSLATTADAVLGGVDIGNSERPFYDLYLNYITPYQLGGTCTFTGGSVNSNLTGDCAAAPAPTNGTNPVYKTSAQLPVSGVTSVTCTVDGKSFSAQTDAQGGLNVWLPATASGVSASSYSILNKKNAISYIASGTVKATDDNYTVNPLTVKCTDAALTGLSVNGQTAVFSGTDTYACNVPYSMTAVGTDKIQPVFQGSKGTFTLYSDQNCQTEITGSSMNLNVGINTAYVKVTAEDGSTEKIYTLAVTRATPGSSGGSSGGSSSSSSGGSLVPSHSSSLPSSLTNASTGAQADLSGAALPAGMTNVTLATTPVARNDTTVPQGANLFRIADTDANLNVIGTPIVYNIKLLDQNGNPIAFTGTVSVRIPVPAGLRGTPRVFRYEESTGKLTDMNATVQNGYLVFATTHFSYYVVAGTGDSITLDTTSYRMPVKGQYQIGVKLTGSKAAAVKFYSTNGKTAAVTKLKNGNYQVTGRNTGTVWIMFDVYDNKNHLLTHASTRVDVKTGIRPRGDSARQTGVF